MTPNTSAISVQNVSYEVTSGFWLKKIQILRNVKFSVPPKSICGLVGPNGAGKTSLIYLLVGVRRSKMGSIHIFGEPFGTSRAKSKLGYLPERPYFYEFLTGRDFLAYFGTLSGVPRRELSARIQEALKTVGMEFAGDRELRKYSKGMLQRIGIAQAILHNPSLLIFDEPMSGLDPAGRREIRDLIRFLGSQGKTILFSSHIIEDIEELCEDVIFIKKGKVIEQGKVSRFVESNRGVTELAFANLSETELSDSLLSEEAWSKIPGGYRVSLENRDASNRAAREIIDRGGEILWMKPARRPLEELFKDGIG